MQFALLVKIVYKWDNKMFNLHHIMQFNSSAQRAFVLYFNLSLSLSEWINMRNILGNNTTSMNHIKDSVFSPHNKDVDGRMESNNIDMIALQSL